MAGLRIITTVFKREDLGYSQYSLHQSIAEPFNTAGVIFEGMLVFLRNLASDGMRVNLLPQLSYTIISRKCSEFQPKKGSPPYSTTPNVFANELHRTSSPMLNRPLAIRSSTQPPSF